MASLDHQDPAPNNHRRQRPLWLIPTIVGIVGIAVIVGWVTYSKRKARQAEMAEVRTAKVERGTISRVISATGVVTAETGAQVKIGSQISGRIKRLYADVGTRVEAGQVIAEIDAPDLVAGVDAAQQGQAQAAAKYQQQLEGAPMLHKQLVAAFEQASEGVQSSIAAVTRTRAALAASQSGVSSARANQRSAEARLRDAEARVRSARAAEPLQSAKTTAEIERARAALNTARTNLTQVEQSVRLEVANAEAQLSQAQAKARLAATNLKRQQALFDQGFAPAVDVDSARTDADVTSEAVAAAQSTLEITRQKVAADVPAAQDQVAQAKASLEAAQAGTYQNVVSTESLRSAEAGMQEAIHSLAAAKEAVTSAQADVRAATAQVAAAQADLRSSRAAQDKALADMTQDRTKQQDIKSAFAAMMQSRAQVDSEKVRLDKSYIRTPISGTVIDLEQQEGETVAASLSAPTLISVVDLDRLQVAAYVDETDIGTVKLGQDAEVTVDAFPDAKVKGIIVKVASAATEQDNVITYQVTVDLGKTGIKGLKPEMTANVDITVERSDNALLVPSEAVKKKTDGAKVVLMRNGVAEAVPVQTGLEDEDNIEIKEGVQDGDEVVLAGFEKLGLEGFSSTAELPGFLKNSSPFGPGTGNNKGKNGAPKSGGAPASGPGGGAGRAMGAGRPR